MRPFHLTDESNVLQMFVASASRFLCGPHARWNSLWSNIKCKHRPICIQIEKLLRFCPSERIFFLSNYNFGLLDFSLDCSFKTREISFFFACHLCGKKMKEKTAMETKKRIHYRNFHDTSYFYCSEYLTSSKPQDSWRREHEQYIEI